MSSIEEEQKRSQDSDVEKGDLIVSHVPEDTDIRVEGKGHVQRNLKARHLQMIALGGTLGTGIFLTVGTALQTGGPLGLVLGFLIMGVVLYSVMVALGEMAALLPVSGSFVHYAERFVNAPVAFAVGWTYWYSYAITLPTEISAASLVISYWNQDINPGAWITIFLVFALLVNLFGVKWYGEVEFWFAALKILTIIGLTILGVVITSGGFPSNAPQDGGKHAIGFRYWNHPGPFQQFAFGDSDHPHTKPGSSGRFLAFWSVFETAAFSYLGTEIVALTAAEAKNPSRNVPKAIRRVFYRILLFYVASTFVLGLIISPNNPELISHAGADSGEGSPWVIAIKDAGLRPLDHCINAVILVAAMSAGNSDLYASSRTLYGLALDRKAPWFFTYVTKGGLPLWALLMTWLIGLLSYMNCSSAGSNAFTWFVNLSSVSGMMSWVTILFSYIRFYMGARSQGIDRNAFPYKAPLQPWFSIFGFFFLCLVILFSAFQVFMKDSWATDTFVTNYLPLPLYFFFAVIWMIVKRTWKFIPASEMDFYHGRRTPEQEAEDEEENAPPTTWYGKFWDWLM